MKAYIKVLSSVLAMIMVMSGVSIFGVSAEDGYTQPEEFIYGDVDFDSKVTVKDATFIQKGVAGLEYLTGVQRFLVSPNGGRVTVKNATEIQKYLADVEMEKIYIGTLVDTKYIDGFSKEMKFIDNRTETDNIVVYPRNIKWDYTLEDFPEYDFSHIEVTYYDMSKYNNPNYPDELVCVLYLSNPGRENVEAAIRALDYRANLDLRNVSLVIHDAIH